MCSFNTSAAELFATTSDSFELHYYKIPLKFIKIIMINAQWNQIIQFERCLCHLKLEIALEITTLNEWKVETNNWAA